MKKAQKFVKKPVEVKAIQYHPHGNRDECIRFIGKGKVRHLVPDEDGCAQESLCLFIQTLEGEMTCSPKDWIVKGVKGECYPVKPKIFALTYAPVDAA